MYSRKHNKIFLEIPKNGSRAVYYSLHAHMPLLGTGHRTIEEILDEVKANRGVTAIALIRDPIDRFVSGLNYHVLFKNEVSVKAEIDYLLDPGTRVRVVLKPQHWFFEKGKHVCHIKLYLYEALDEALKEFEYPEEGSRVHNRHKHKVSKDQILKEPRIEEVWEFYKEDFELREKALKEYTDG